MANTLLGLDQMARMVLETLEANLRLGDLERSYRDGVMARSMGFDPVRTALPLPLPIQDWRTRVELQNKAIALSLGAVIGRIRDRRMARSAAQQPGDLAAQPLDVLWRQHAPCSDAAWPEADRQVAA